ncbi:hypothetical protein SmJEL517_g05112 [Synchytrium microbalum]|uniref:YEATS domain-containing protein n=1 Tax=Synchytrium microbalum TaxID=1806994 RepID=A0A507BN68_9FUNG|nr:uncharacterized protein SmJEL517_g05112 [Synchytrium microbalum]TPX31580.1 hypothetical protein SmJEL517_g05112 [Synchytrium microbalum]
MGKQRDSPLVKSCRVVARCRFRKSQEPEHRHSVEKFKEWNVTITCKNPGADLPDEAKDMPYVQCVIFHPHPDFGLGPQVRTSAPYRFEAHGYVPHEMMVEVHFVEGPFLKTMAPIRFEGSDIKKDAKRWSYYDKEEDKVFSGFTENFRQLLIQGNLLQTPRNSPSPPDTTAGSTPKRKHPALQRGKIKSSSPAVTTAADSSSKRSSLSKEIVYEESYDSDDSIHSNHSTSKESSSTSPPITRGHAASGATTTNGATSNGHNIKSKPSSVASNGKQKSSSSSSHPVVIVRSSTTASSPSTAKRKRTVEDDDSDASSKGGDAGTKRAKSEPLSSNKETVIVNEQAAVMKVKQGVVAMNVEQEMVNGDDGSEEDDDRVFHDPTGKSFTLNDVFERIERLDLEGRPVVDLMILIKRAKDASPSVFYSFDPDSEVLQSQLTNKKLVAKISSGPFDFDLNSLPDQTVLDLWQLLDQAEEKGRDAWWTNKTRK